MNKQYSQLIADALRREYGSVEDALCVHEHVRRLIRAAASLDEAVANRDMLNPDDQWTWVLAIDARFGVVRDLSTEILGFELELPRP